MKKLLIASNAITFTLLCLLGSKCQHETVSPSKNICTVEEPVGITLEEFMDVTARYKTEGADLLTKNAKAFTYLADINGMSQKNIVGAGFEDARVAWYPLDTLKKFICTIEKYSDSLNIPSSQLGINFYYAIYGDNKHRRDYSFRHTLYCVPTVGHDSIHYDFDPRYASKYGKDSAYYLSDFARAPLQTSVNLLMLGASSAPPNPLDVNKMNLCPPTCPPPPPSGGGRVRKNTFDIINERWPLGNPYARGVEQ